MALEKLSAEAISILIKVPCLGFQPLSLVLYRDLVGVTATESILAYGFLNITWLTSSILTSQATV